MCAVRRKPLALGAALISSVGMPAEPRTIHIEVGPNETAAQVAARRPDVFLAQEQPDGSVVFSVRGQAVEITLQRALYPHAPLYSEPVPMSAHMAESAAILRRAARRTLHA